jgi:hypothetical protein
LGKGRLWHGGTQASRDRSRYAITYMLGVLKRRLTGNEAEAGVRIEAASMDRATSSISSGRRAKVSARCTLSRRFAGLRSWVEDVSRPLHLP